MALLVCNSTFAILLSSFLKPNAEFSGGRGLAMRSITDAPRPSAATVGYATYFRHGSAFPVTNFVGFPAFSSEKRWETTGAIPQIPTAHDAFL